MKNIIALGLILCMVASIVILSGCQQEDVTTFEPTEAKPIVLSEEHLSQLQEAFDQKLENRDFQGIAYIVYNGQTIYERATAKANTEEDIDADINTVYRVGSVTKQFTAAAVMLLAERGLLSLDDTLDRYFPGYDNAQRITIDQLLRMRSGLINYTSYIRDIVAAHEADYQSNTAEENRRIIEDYCLSHELNFEPGESHEYSNTNYMLLGEIIEQVSGMTYQNFMQKEIFDKAGMSNSGFLDTWDRQTEHMAVGYHAYEDEALFAACDGIAFACGDLLTTAADLLKWADALRENTILSEDSLTVMADSTGNSSYGRGVYVADQGDTLWHAGNFPPFYAYLLLTRGQDAYTEILISNYNDETTLDTADHLYRIFQNTVYNTTE